MPQKNLRYRHFVQIGLKLRVMKLIIGNKRYSSWSLRPWVLMKHFGIPFEEKLIPLDQPGTRAEILHYSPSAKVPVLIDGDIHIWESLAIAEYLNEKFPDLNMWPESVRLRARARSIANEMHGGFSELRHHLSHDLQKRLDSFNSQPANADIGRIKEIWTECLNNSRGPFLFGTFSIADAMYAPVVNRFVSYGVPIEGQVKAYIQTMRALPAHQEWIVAGEREELRMPKYESFKP